MNFWKDLKKPFTVLAPMEDVTDVVFRSIVADCGRPDVFFTEFTSADGLASPGREKVGKRLIKNDKESPIVAQIWGKKPENYLKAAQDIVEMGFDGIDINMGCPVRKIVKQGVCSALIDNEPLAHEVIEATIEGAAGKIPVSVKTRLGFRVKRTEEWAEFLLNHDIKALTIHGRIAKEMSKFPCDWDEIKKVVDLKNKLGKDIVIIGNGDVSSLEEVDIKAKETGVDGVMIGRGVFKDPFVFNPTKSITDLSLNERLDLVETHVDRFANQYGTKRNFEVLKRFFKIYVSDFDGANEIRQKFMEVKEFDEVKELISSLRS
ncbi:tRNA-dihydrouridine synthase [Candidatus Dojkabacteria bacterium]|uniref:tRNA-dihydrouridine synthase n=1 Tax=Candidatus Dojkabacteria bacterium TaxID=2099670 RepID=A0A955I8Y5_9BACT|nr:tRNA-dihydrouridine synthase [Candidatus Dojkabacteria bacterium]